MLSKVEVISAQGVLLTLPLENYSEGYAVQDIEGLDPVPAILISSPFGQMDGEQYQSSRRDKRNIRITLGYEPDFVNNTVQSLRKRLYGIFMPKSRVMLRFYQDGEPMVQISGIVETFDTPKFAKEPMAIISIMCFDSDFYNPTPTVIPGQTTAGTVETPHTYPGSVETGILFRLLVNRNVSGFTIYHRLPDDTLRSMEFQSAVPLQNGDVLTISTVPGNKFVNLLRAGTTSSYLYGVTTQSNWISLFPGINKLRVQAWGVAIPYQIEYTAKFGGL